MRGPVRRSVQTMRALATAAPSGGGGATRGGGMAPPPEPQPVLGAWKAKEAKGALPDVTHIRPSDIQLQHHPRWRKGCQTLMRAIDLEARFRHDATVAGGSFYLNNSLAAATTPTAPGAVAATSSTRRSELFWGPNATALPGSVVLVDQVTSRLNPQQKYFAGVLLGVREKGIMSSMVLRCMVMDVGVEMTFPIYSPMIANITVLKESPPDIQKRGMKAVYWAREKYAKSSLNFDEIEGMVLKHKNQIFRSKQLLAEKSAKVKGNSASKSKQ